MLACMSGLAGLAERCLRFGRLGGPVNEQTGWPGGRARWLGRGGVTVHAQCRNHSACPVHGVCLVSAAIPLRVLPAWAHLTFAAHCCTIPLLFRQLVESFQAPRRRPSGLRASAQRADPPSLGGPTQRPAPGRAPLSAGLGTACSARAAAVVILAPPIFFCMADPEHEGSALIIPR